MADFIDHDRHVITFKQVGPKFYYSAKWDVFDNGLYIGNIEYESPNYYAFIPRMDHKMPRSVQGHLINAISSLVKEHEAEYV